jgi:cysteinyl-tRNA synthetase
MPREIRLFNTLSRRLEPFVPLEDDLVRIYTCGPTVYNFVHIGNLRTFLFEDVLRRTLRAFGYRVDQVMNLTDIDDKTIKGAAAEGVSLRDFTERYAKAFFGDLETLGAERVERYPRATDYIQQMVALVERLKARGHTYEQDGSTYFRIASLPAYGKLSGAHLDQVKVGARVDADDYDKEDARDFVLWKARKEGEPYWETSLGPGRPGWHLECSTMAMDLLGESIDIHAGGVDLVFPHHENEIAQSEGASGKPFVRTWLHAEHLVVDGQKMSKSLGNFYTLRDLLARGFSPLAIRYLLISVPYRQKLNFTLDGLAGATAAVERIGNTLRRLRYTPPSADGDLSEAEVEGFLEEFDGALADDLNTARALAAFHTLLTRVNQALDANGISAAVRAALARALGRVAAVLNVLPEEASGAGEEDGEIDRLIAERNAARASRDFARADAIRSELSARGVVLEDTAHGTVWRRSR